jgi:membrane-bound ClpP family serine protease
MVQLTWMLSFIPEWFWTMLLIGGVVALFAARFFPQFPLKIGGIVAIVISVWFLGAASNEAKWEARVKELEEKVAAAEVVSKQENVVVQEKIVKQKEFIKGKTEYITRYIDKEIIKNEEVIKYIENCPVPQIIIDTHNAAALMNKAAEDPKK